MAKKKNSKKKNPKVKEMKDKVIQEQKSEMPEAAEVIQTAEVIETAEPLDAAEVIETTDPVEAAEVTTATNVTKAAEAVEAAVTPEVTEATNATKIAEAATSIGTTQDTVVIDAADTAEATKDTVIIDAADLVAEHEPEAPAAAEVTDAPEPEALDNTEASDASEPEVPEINGIAKSPGHEIPEVIELSGPVTDEPVNEAKASEPVADDPASNVEPAVHADTPQKAEYEEAADTEFETITEASKAPVETTALTTVIPAVTEKDPVKAESKPKKSWFKDIFSDMPVTRKFLALSLVSALLLNAAITAGLMGLFTSSVKKDIEKVNESVSNSAPWDFFDHDQGSPGRDMTPPGWNNDYDQDDDNRYGNNWGDNDNGYGNDWDDDDMYDDDSGFYPWSGQQEDNDSQQNQQPQQDQQNQQDQQGQQNASKVSIGIVISENNGVYIAQVTGNNAQKAGFKPGDKIVSFDGKSINDSNSLISEVQKHKAGDKVKVVVQRDGKETTIKTTLE